jgi:hypothetical protein
MFVTKLTDAGTTSSFAWAQRAGSFTDEYSVAVAARGSNVYVLGGFNGSAVNFGSTSLSVAGGTDMYLAKLTDTGNQGAFIWAQCGGGPDDEKPATLAIDGPNLYIAGTFSGAGASYGNSTLSSTGLYDVVVAHAVDAGSTGGFVWGQSAGGAAADYAGGVAVGGGSVYVGGSVTPSAAFGRFKIYATAIPSAYLASFTTTVLATAPSASVTNFQVFPNPAHASATVNLPAAGKLRAETSLLLIDEVGRAVRALPIPLGATSLDLPLGGLAPGVYTVRIGTGSRLLVVE